MAVITPETNTSPATCNLLVGFVVPIPRLPDAGMKTKALGPVVAIPTEVTPVLFANVKNTGVEIGS